MAAKRMETERERNLRRIYDLLDGRRLPGGGVVIELSKEKRKREARIAAKKRRRLAQLPDGDLDSEPSGESE
jgi:hypothetical protein